MNDVLLRIISEVGKEIFPKTDTIKMDEDEMNKMLELYLFIVLNVYNNLFKPLKGK